MKNTQTVTAHAPAARAARKEPGVWVPGPVYPTVASAQAAARRVGTARCLSAYLPVGAFEGYGARCEDGGALWVRYIGDGTPVLPMPQRMTVRVPSYGEDVPDGGVRIMTVSVAPTCPVCGGPRGWDNVTADPFVRDGVTHVRDKWVNRCGHRDQYAHVLAEAARTPAAPGGQGPQDAPALKLPELTVTCPLCSAQPGELCRNRAGTRYLRLSTHADRWNAWKAAKVAAVPAAKVILTAARSLPGMHARQAADLIRERGFRAEADVIGVELRLRNGHLSAKQAVALLVARAEATQGGAR